MTDLVRQATWRDEAALFDLLVALHAHNDAGWGTSYSARKVLDQIEVGTRSVFDTRTHPNDHRMGRIGVIGPEGGPLIGSVGLFIEPATWFADDVVAMIELWLFVRPGERDRRRLEKALFAFADDHHAEAKAALREHGYKFSFDLQTGFMHRGSRFEAMARLWRRMSGARPVGMLFSKK